MLVKILFLPLFLSSMACKGGLLQSKEGASTQYANAAQSSTASSEQENQLVFPKESEEDGIKLLEDALANITVNGSPAGSHLALTYGNKEEAELEKSLFTAFWKGEYEKIESLRQAYLDYKAPRAPIGLIESRLGYINLWKWQERYRNSVLGGSLPRAVSDCAEHFKTAFELAPQNMVMRGFGSNCRMFKALLEQNLQDLFDATKTGVEAIKGLSEYAPFALSYSFLLAANDSPRFKIGMAMLQRVLDVCYARDIDRENPDIRNLQRSAETLARPYQYFCSNTLMAPHAREGFLFTLADALVKAKQLKAAAVMYENVKASSGFATWPFRGLVEERLSNLEGNHLAFNLPLSMLEKPSHQTMAVGGPAACTICHRAGPEELPQLVQNFDLAFGAKATISGHIFINPSPSE